MKVLQVHSRYRDYGGEERVVENDARILRAAGHEVRQFEAENQGSTVGAIASLAGSSWNLRQAARLRRSVDEWRPDVAQVHNTWFSLSPSVIGALGRGGIPVVMTIHNYRPICAGADLWRDGRPCRDCVGRPFAGPGVRHGCYRDSRPLSLAVASASMVQGRLVSRLSPGSAVVPSGFLARVLVEGGFREDLFTVTPWTTSDPGGRPAPPSESGEVYFIGRLEPVTKGVERLVSVWNRAKTAGLLGGLTLNIVGTGTLEGSEAIAGPGIRTLGHLDRGEIDRLLLSGRALVVPSLWDEPFGLVAIEAFAAGLPVIGTDRGALPETVGLLGEDCLFSPEDEAAWVESLSLLDDDRFVDERGVAARGLFLSRFSPDQGIQRLEEVLGRAAGVGIRPPTG